MKFLKTFLPFIFLFSTIFTQNGYSQVFGDNLGNHRARKPIDLQNHTIDNLSTNKSIKFSDGTYLIGGNSTVLIEKNGVTNALLLEDTLVTSTYFDGSFTNLSFKGAVVDGNSIATKTIQGANINDGAITKDKVIDTFFNGDITNVNNTLKSVGLMGYPIQGVGANSHKYPMRLYWGAQATNRYWELVSPSELLNSTNGFMLVEIYDTDTNNIVDWAEGLDSQNTNYWSLKTLNNTTIQWFNPTLDNKVPLYRSDGSNWIEWVDLVGGGDMLKSEYDVEETNSWPYNIIEDGVLGVAESFLYWPGGTSITHRTQASIKESFPAPDGSSGDKFLMWKWTGSGYYLTNAIQDDIIVDGTNVMAEAVYTDTNSLAIVSPNGGEGYRLFVEFMPTNIPGSSLVNASITSNKYGLQSIYFSHLNSNLFNNIVFKDDFFTYSNGEFPGPTAKSDVTGSYFSGLTVNGIYGKKLVVGTLSQSVNDYVITYDQSLDNNAGGWKLSPLGTNAATIAAATNTINNGDQGLLATIDSGGTTYWATNITVDTGSGAVDIDGLAVQPTGNPQDNGNGYAINFKIWDNNNPGITNGPFIKYNETNRINVREGALFANNSTYTLSWISNALYGAWNHTNNASTNAHIVNFRTATNLIAQKAITKPTSPTTDDALIYNGSTWTNQKISNLIVTNTVLTYGTQIIDVFSISTKGNFNNVMMGKVYLYPTNAANSQGYEEATPAFISLYSNSSRDRESVLFRAAIDLYSYKHAYAGSNIVEGGSQIYVGTEIDKFYADDYLFLSDTNSGNSELVQVIDKPGGDILQLEESVQYDYTGENFFISRAITFAGVTLYDGNENKTIYGDVEFPNIITNHEVRVDFEILSQ